MTVIVKHIQIYQSDATTSYDNKITFTIETPRYVRKNSKVRLHHVASTYATLPTTTTSMNQQLILSFSGLSNSFSPDITIHAKTTNNLESSFGISTIQAICFQSMPDYYLGRLESKSFTMQYRRVYSSSTSITLPHYITFTFIIEDGE